MSFRMKYDEDDSDDENDEKSDNSDDKDGKDYNVIDEDNRDVIRAIGQQERDKLSRILIHYILLCAHKFTCRKSSLYLLHLDWGVVDI